MSKWFYWFLFDRPRYVRQVIQINWEVPWGVDIYCDSRGNSCHVKVQFQIVNYTRLPWLRRYQISRSSYCFGIKQETIPPQNSKTFQAAVTPDIHRDGGRRKLHIGTTSSKTKLEKVWLPSKIVLIITQRFLKLPAYTIMFFSFILHIQHRWERSLSICIKGDGPRVRILYLKSCTCWATKFQISSNNVGFNNVSWCGICCCP